MTWIALLTYNIIITIFLFVSLLKSDHSCAWCFFSSFFFCTEKVTHMQWCGYSISLLRCVYVFFSWYSSNFLFVFNVYLHFPLPWLLSDYVTIFFSFSSSFHQRLFFDDGYGGHLFYRLHSQQLALELSLFFQQKKNREKIRSFQLNMYQLLFISGFFFWKCLARWFDFFSCCCCLFSLSMCVYFVYILCIYLWFSFLSTKKFTQNEIIFSLPIHI